MGSTTRAYGSKAAVLAVLAVTPYAVLLRVEKEAGGSASVIQVWHYGMLTLVNLCIGRMFEGGVKKLAKGVWLNCLPVLGASIIIVFINVGFTLSLLYFEPAFALLLISLNILWATLLGKVLLGDPLPIRTAIALLVSLCAIIAVFVPKILDYSQDDGESSSSGAGTTVAFTGVPFFTGFAVAALLTFSRWQKGAQLEAAPIIGALLSVLGAAVFLLVFQERPPSDLVADLTASFWIAILVNAICIGVYDIVLITAPRFITSTEVSLILLAEVILSPLCVWMVYGDIPDKWTLIGGVVLLLALSSHEVACIIAHRPIQPPKNSGKYSSSFSKGLSAMVGNTHHATGHDMVDDYDSTDSARSSLPSRPSITSLVVDLAGSLEAQ
mmetsp:Transcript_5606/g.10875  ORF Transcript_5606/g.10875 Transcript_5606/m.10875 type:complete len:383 (-) Transcript_5606:209-1357(-)